MISLKSDGNDIPVTISAIYLEPNGDLNKIPVEIFDSDIIGGDLNNAETGLEKIGVYHLKGISNIRTIEINKKISDHNIKIGEAKVNLKTNDRLSTIVINDKNIVNANNNELMLDGQKDSIVLKSPKKTIIKDNYSMIPTDLDKYDNFNQIKEIYNIEIKEKYNRIEKIIRSGIIEKDGWFKINKLFNEKKKSEIYQKDHMANDILEYYKKIYDSNPGRKSLNHESLKNNIYIILQIMINSISIDNNPIWPPNSNSNDFNGFSQKILEKNN